LTAPRSLPALAVAAALTAAAAPAALAQDLSAEEVMRRADGDHRADDERGLVDMVIVGDDDSRQRREMEVLIKTGEGDDDMNIMRFVAPANVRGTAVLTVEATGRADDQWLYLPALRKTKRIASSQRTQRFAGTDFTYEDLRSEDFEGFDYRFGDDAELEGRACYVVIATPKDGHESGYSRREIYVEKERFLVHKIEYYDARERHQKTFEARGFEEVDGLWRASMSGMEDHQRGTQTVWRFKERDINPGLPDSTFTVRTLERGL